MANPKPIVIKITGDADSLERELARARAQLDQLAEAAKDSSEEIEKAGRASQKIGELAGGAGGKISDLASEFTGKLGPAGSSAQAAVEKVTGKLGAIPVPAAAAAAGVAAVGTAMFKIGEASLDEYTNFVRETDKLAIASGFSSETASALVGQLELMGLSADDGADAFSNMNDQLINNTDQLDALGISMVRNADGSANMDATLQLVMQSLAGTTDQAQRAAIGGALFGETWYKIAPVLMSTGGDLDALKDKIAELRGEVHDADRGAVRNLDAALGELGQATKAAQVEIGRGLVPALTDATFGLIGISDALKGATFGFLDLGDVSRGALSAMTLGVSDALGVIGKWTGKADEAKKKEQEKAKALEESKRAYDEQKAATEAANKAQAEAEAAADLLAAATDRTTDAIDRATKADKDRKQAQDDLTNAVLASADVQLNYERAERTTIKALADQHQAETDLAVAVRDHGAGSDEAKAASDRLADQTLTTKESLLGQAKAALDSAEHNATLAGKQLDAGQKADIQRGFLMELAKTLEPGSPLRAWLDDYIGELNTIPSSKKTVLTVEKHYVDVGGVVDTGGVALASGGPLKRGQLALVGEEGPELVVPTADSMVLPAGQTKSIMSGSGASSPSQVGLGGGSVVINISGVVGDRDAVIRWVHEGLRSYETSRRGS